MILLRKSLLLVLITWEYLYLSLREALGRAGCVPDRSPGQPGQRSPIQEARVTQMGPSGILAT